MLLLRIGTILAMLTTLASSAAIPPAPATAPDASPQPDPATTIISDTNSTLFTASPIHLSPKWITDRLSKSTCTYSYNVLWNAYQIHLTYPLDYYGCANIKRSIHLHSGWSCKMNALESSTDIKFRTTAFTTVKDIMTVMAKQVGWHGGTCTRYVQRFVHNAKANVVRGFIT